MILVIACSVCTLVGFASGALTMVILFADEIQIKTKENQSNNFHRC